MGGIACSIFADAFLCWKQEKKKIWKPPGIFSQAGIDVKTWDSEPMPVGGCGAQMRPSDWSGKKTPLTLQRDIIYHLAVYKEDEDSARRLISELSGSSH